MDGVTALYVNITTLLRRINIDALRPHTFKNITEKKGEITETVKTP
jgi:hypothetical protein